MKRIVIFLGILLSCAVSLAGVPSVRAGYDIWNVWTNTDGSWGASGNVYDASVIAFCGTNVSTGMVVACESRFGDIDMYSITNISTQTVTMLVCNLRYAETGSPRAGMPTVGYSALCSTSGLGAVIAPNPSACRVSEYLFYGVLEKTQKDNESNLVFQARGATNIVRGTADGYDATTRVMTYMPYDDAPIWSAMRYVEGNVDYLFALMSYYHTLNAAPMRDGYFDWFNDQSGVDLTAGVCTGQTWDAAGYYAWSAYSVSPDIASQSKLIHYKLNDSNATTTVANSGILGPTTNGLASRNTSVVTTNGRINQAFAFNGSDAITNVSVGLTGALSRTVCLWAKADASFATDKPLVHWGTNAVNHGNAEFMIQGGTKLYIYKVSGDPSFTLSPAISTNWHHYAYTYDGTTIAMYYDGIRGYNLAGTMLTYNSIVTIGKRSICSGCNSDWVGALDDVRIYSTALTSNQIWTLYNSGAGTESDGTTVTNGGPMTLVGTNAAAHVMTWQPTVSRASLAIEDVNTNLVLTDIVVHTTIDGWTNVTTNALTRKEWFGAATSNFYLYHSDTNGLRGTGSNFNWRIVTTNTNRSGRVTGILLHAR